MLTRLPKYIMSCNLYFSIGLFITEKDTQLITFMPLHPINNDRIYKKQLNPVANLKRK